MTWKKTPTTLDEAAAWDGFSAGAAAYRRRKAFLDAAAVSQHRGKPHYIWHCEMRGWVETLDEPGGVEIFWEVLGQKITCFEELPITPPGAAMSGTGVQA